MKAGGTEYSKAQIQKGNYTPVRGDIIIFKSNGDSHVGIVVKPKMEKFIILMGTIQHMEMEIMRVFIILTEHILMQVLHVSLSLNIKIIWLPQEITLLDRLRE